MTQAGFDLIKAFESCWLTAYQDEVGIWTLGWGRARGIQPGQACTQSQANQWLIEDVSEAESDVLGCLGEMPVNDNQLSALISFVYNVGLGETGVKSGFEHLIHGEPSTLLKLLLQGDFKDAANEFLIWSHAGGEVVPGLLRRRKAERDLFLKPVEGAT